MEQNILTSRLYQDDLYGWTRGQAALLRASRFQDLDLDNVVEEIETLGRADASALRSSLRLDTVRLLKLLHQPAKATDRWRGTIAGERINAERPLMDNPDLKPKLDDLFPEAYADARRIAAVEPGLPLSTLPVEPHFSPEQVCNHDDVLG